VAIVFIFLVAVFWTAAATVVGKQKKKRNIYIKEELV